MGVLNTSASFRDETYGEVKTLGYNAMGRIIRRRTIRGRNVQGGLILVPCCIEKAKGYFKFGVCKFHSQTVRKKVKTDQLKTINCFKTVSEEE
jgi:hypothetical protein